MHQITKLVHSDYKQQSNMNVDVTQVNQSRLSKAQVYWVRMAFSLEFNSLPKHKYESIVKFPVSTRHI